MHTLISDSHRILRIACEADGRLYKKEEFERTSASVSLGFWSGALIPSIRHRASESISLRLTAAAQRAREHSNEYGCKVPGNAEICAEVLFDHRLMKPQKGADLRRQVRDQFRYLDISGKPVEIALPLFSRKPVCPMKNRGHYPDLSEITSLSRCYEVAALLSSLHPHGAVFRVYSDGNKYRRACQTPPDMIRDYQHCLRHWCEDLAISDLVKVVDYESELLGSLGDYDSKQREANYETTVCSLTEQFSDVFDPRDLSLSMSQAALRSPTGEQISFTFRSMLSSVFYNTNDIASKIRTNDDEAQTAYVLFMKGVQENIESGANTPIPAEYEKAIAMREEAWNAAIRYVAISLTDRELGNWSRLNPDGLKFTIHSKPGEFHFIAASPEFFSMTAQHCVGGIKPTAHSSKVTFAYRFERESQRERPLLLTPDSVGNCSALDQMIKQQQPICYLDHSIDDPIATLQEYLELE